MSDRKDKSWIVAETLTGDDASPDQTVKARLPLPPDGSLGAVETFVGDEGDEDDDAIDLIGRAEDPSGGTQEITGSAIVEVESQDLAEEAVISVESQDVAWISEEAPAVGSEDAGGAVPWEVASQDIVRSDAPAFALRSRLTQELVADAVGTPFAVATDELLLEDLLDGAPLDPPAAHEGTAEFFTPAGEGDFDERSYWEERAEALREQQKLVRNTRKEPGVLRELGRIYDQRLNDRDAAMEAYERLSELVPGDDEAFFSLDQIYQRAQEAEKLINLLLDRQEQVDSTHAKAELLARVAEIYLHERRRDEAEVVIDAAVSLDPSNARVLRASELLSQGQVPDVLPAVSEGSSLPPPVPPAPQDPLEELEARLATAAGVSERVAILEKLAMLHGAREQPQEAARYLHEVIALDRRRASAYRQLAALYQRHERFDDLARVLELHARAVAPAVRVEILRQLATIYEERLADAPSALATYERLHELAPEDAPAIRALIRFHEERGDAQSLLAILREASSHLQGAERVELLYRQGKILAEAFGDSFGAEEQYQRALELDPSHGASILELKEIYRARGDWGKAVRMMRAAEAASAAPAQKARFLYEAGMTLLEHLDDERAATEMLTRTLEIDPDHRDAAEALTEIFFRHENYDRLGPILDILLRKTPRDDRSRLIDLNHKIGVVAMALGDDERATRALKKVLDFDPRHTEALLGLGDLSFEAEDYRQAYSFYRELRGVLDNLDPDRQRRVLLRQGRSARAVGSLRDAKACLDRALDASPKDPEILAELASLQLDGSDWQGALASKEALIEGAEGDDARKLLLEIGDIYRDKMRDGRRAAEAYRRGLTFADGDHVLLHRLLDLYSETEQWEETIEICEALARREDEPPRVRAKYLGVAASLYDKRLDRPDDALRFYNRVLDIAPDELKAFSAIDAICTRLKDWRKLEQNYGKMIQRLPPEGKVELKVMLWHNLGEVLRSRRRDFEGAIAAFEVAQELDPQNAQRRRILGELYLSCGADYVDRAIKLYQRIVDETPQDGDACRILRKLYLDARHYDRAWILSGVLVFIDQADREIVDFYRHYRRRSIPRARARIIDDHWPRYLYHPQQDPYVSAILSIIASPVASMTARSHAQFDLKRKERYDFQAQQDHPFGRLFLYMQGVLHTPPFDLFLRPEKPTSLQLAHTTEATSLVAGGHILRQERREKELAFIIGKQLALLRPDLFLRVALLGRAQLRGVFWAACLLVNPKISLPPSEERSIAKGAERLRKKLAYPQVEQIGRILSRLGSLERLDLGRWWDAVELTTDRVGLLLCNDLGVAAKMITAEPSAGGFSPRERVDALIHFAASDAYAQLRRELGVTIEDGV